MYTLMNRETEIEINGKRITIKEYMGVRVVTFADIDLLHQRPAGTARRNFNKHKKHLIEGVDYFVRNSYEAKKEFNIIAPNGLILLTESGYLMLVKSFRDELAWQVQRQLINGYFCAVQMQKQDESSSLSKIEYLNEEIASIKEELNLLKKDNEKLKEENRDFKQMYKQNQAKINFLKEDFKELNKEKEQLQLENREFTQILKRKCEDIYHLREKSQMYYEDIYHLKEENEKLNRKIQESDKYFNEIIQFNYENICCLKEDVKKIKNKAKRINDIIADRLNSLKRDSLIADTGIKILFEKLKK